MEDRDYSYTIGALVRLKVWLKPGHARDLVDEAIEELVNEAEGL